MAVWGAPLDDERQADHAVAAAMEMIQSTRDTKIYAHPLKTRIGINSGPSLVGNLGSRFRFDYTAIGDNINLAARLEGFNKQVGTDILITQSTYERLKDKYVLRPIGKFQLVGKDLAVPFYEVITHHAEDPPWFDTFAEGLAAFSRRDWTDASGLFGETNAQRRQKDGPASFYLQKIEEFKTEPPTDRDWSGEIRVTSK